MHKALSLLFVSSILLSLSSFGQIGNEWIRSDQDYYKIKVAREGICVIDRSDLQEAGFNVNELDPRFLQLFLNGKEEHIYVSGQNDGSFDVADKIYFYAKPNDGLLDEPLYRTSGEQPHQYASLYTDSSVYFLTLSFASTGKRYTIQSDQDVSGLTPDSYFIHESARWFRNQWFDGSPFSQRGSFSEHTEGEGWMSSDVRGSGIAIDLNTPGFLTSTGRNIELKALAFGKSDPAQPGDYDAQGNNHELSVYYGDQTNLIYRSRGRGYYTNSIETTISSSDMVDRSRIWFVSSFGAKQRQAVSFVKINYPRTYSGISESVFKLKPTSSSFIRLTNYSGSADQPVVWDLSNKQIVPASSRNDSVIIKVSSVASSNLLIGDSSALLFELNGADIHPVKFTAVDLSSNANYLILSHSKLKEACEEYKRYRESSSGGNYQVDIVYADLLYDQFYFGYHHPLAIKNFIRGLWQNGGKSLRHINILGKGQSYYLCTYDHARRDGLDLVPAMGFPPSDHLYTTGLDNGDAVPTIPIGRIPAKTNEEIRQYLDKVKSHEANLNDPSDWKKHVIHISGGTSKFENQLFRNYLGNFEARLASDSFGGYTTVFSKDQNVIIQENLTSSIINAVNDGSTMLTYFGHGSSDVLEVDIGQVNQYNNSGRLPLFYFNGCILGNTFDITSLGEKFLLEPNVGAVNWLASTNYGFTTILHDYGNVFHNNFFKEHYGSTVGEVLQRTITEYMSEPDPLRRTMCHQFVCHGDPAMRYFSPALPDFTLDPSRTGLDENSLLSGGDSVLIDIGLKNLGKTGTDSVVLELVRSNGSGFSKSYVQRVPAPDYSNSYAFRVEKSDTFRGLNRIALTLDPENEVEEQEPNGEMNNTLVASFYIPFENIYLHKPRRNEIVNQRTVALSVRSGSSDPQPITIEVEIDTAASFDSPSRQTSSGSGTTQIDVNFNIGASDSTDHYWRARLNGAETWTVGNFAYIDGAGTGSSQENSDLLERGTLNRMWADSAGRFHFSTTTSQQYHIQTAGRNGNFRRGLRINGYLARMFWFVNPGIQLVAINPRDESRYMVNSQFHTTSPRTPESFGYTALKDNPYYILGNPTGVYEFNTKVREVRDSLALFLSNIPSDYHVFAYNGTETGVDEWEEALLSEFDRFGWTSLEGRLQSNHPVALLGRKNTPTEAFIITADTNNDVITADRQNISLTTNLSIPHASSSLTTERIGPSTSWSDARFTTRENSSDSSDVNTIEIIAFDTLGKEFVFLSADSNWISLAGIDAGTHPYLRLRIHFTDSLNRTINQLKRWVCLFEPAPDGNLVHSATKMSKDTFRQGESIVVHSSFENLGTDTFSSTDVSIELQDANRSIAQSILDTISPIPPGESIERTDTFQWDDYQGDAFVLVNYNPNASPPEPEFLNNSRILPFFVSPYQKNARVDLRIDGRTIMDQEIVRPDPEISVFVAQNDSFIFYDDLQFFSMYMKYPGEDSFRTVDLYAPGIDFNPANKVGGSTKLTLQSEILVDGLYTIRVVVQNPVNPSKEDVVEARFEVINRQAVSNVYFYPNPFTTSARIVYTLTGATPPDQFRIDIYTISGRRVKSIDLHEMEDLTIGTHLSQYQWDATDEFGDRLANGVYLYKVQVRSQGQELEHFERPNDDLFHQDFGKLYIMR